MKYSSSPSSCCVPTTRITPFTLSRRKHVIGPAPNALSYFTYQISVLPRQKYSASSKKVGRFYTVTREKLKDYRWICWVWGNIRKNVCIWPIWFNNALNRFQRKTLPTKREYRLLTTLSDVKHPLFSSHFSYSAQRIQQNQRWNLFQTSRQGRQESALPLFGKRGAGWRYTCQSCQHRKGGKGSIHFRDGTMGIDTSRSSKEDANGWQEGHQ